MMQKYSGNIYLIGFMGCGKSTIAPQLAKKLKRISFDTDDWIATDSGMSIVEIFANRGEAWFREKEKQCLQFVARLNEMVVAVGGGAVLATENWLLLKKSGVTIYLSCSPELIFDRVQHDNLRPLLQVTSELKLERIRQLLAQREPYYQMADIILPVEKQESIEQVTQRILNRLEDLI